MKTRFNFNDVIERVKKSLKIKNDCDVAEKLGMKAGTFNARKKSNSLPYEEILVLANAEKLDFNWLLTGEGEMYRNGTEKSEQIDPELQSIIDVCKALNDRDKRAVLLFADDKKQLNELKSRLDMLCTSEAQLTEDCR